MIAVVDECGDHESAENVANTGICRPYAKDQATAVLAEPVAHDGHDGRPASRLSEPVEYPERQVPELVVDLEPLADHPENEHVNCRESHAKREHQSQVEPVAQNAAYE
jgi:hypothetical protein